MFVATRKKDVATDNKDRFQTSLDIAELVRSEVQKATQPLMERIQKLETGVLTSRTILYAHFQRLSWWDERGRHGALPLPEDKDFEALGIDPQMFESTVERAVATEAVSKLRQDETTKE
ncbi:hypothetical protein [Frigoribacterium sp. RIT-PI-h]|uniref:hypothetical protein n=1 Tax=Frigoribacterium sp. RIT-PI-h TaxID=1690245 RepID=UPI0013791757|nr:hypothetical protein [Frigoribacterium sp. RIT-PI-h]